MNEQGGQWSAAEVQAGLVGGLATGTISRRDFVKGAVALGMSPMVIRALLTGFTPSPVAAAKRAAQFEQAAATKREATITMAISATPGNLDIEVGGGPVAEDLMNALNDNFFRWKTHPSGPSGGFIASVTDSNYSAQFEPRMAESWSVQGNTVTFNLRHGVMSHAGNELTSADVVYTYKRAYAMAGVGAFLNQVAGMQSINDLVATDKYTVTFTLHQPPTIFLMAVPITHRIIYDSTEMLAHATSSDPWSANFIAAGDAGFGAYKLQSYVAGQKVIIEAFANHFNGPPPVKKITLTAVPNDDDRTALLIRGDVDMAYELTPKEYRSLAANKGVNVWSFPSVTVALYMIDPLFSPFDSLKVRQAVAYAAPYDAVVDTIYDHYARRAGGPIPSWFPGYQSSFTRYSTDLGKAKRLLEAAGHKSGFSADIVYNNDDPVQEPMSELLASNMSQIGVNLNLQALTPGAYSTQEFAKTKAGKTALMTYVDGPFVPDPYYDIYLNFESTSPLNFSQVKVAGPSFGKDGDFDRLQQSDPARFPCAVDRCRASSVGIRCSTGPPDRSPELCHGRHRISHLL